MFDVSVKIDKNELPQIVKDIRLADKKAARDVADRIVIPAMRVALRYTGSRPAPLGQLGVVSGRTKAQLGTKFWKDREGMINAAVKVIGDRAHIARFNEGGTQSHGRHGRPLPAHHMFETVGRALRGAIEQSLVREFEANMRALGHVKK
jgi:hypothetical protein